MTDQPTSSTSNSKEAGKLLRKIILPVLVIISIIALIADAITTRMLSSSSKLSNSYKVAKLENQEEYLQEIPIFGPSISRNAYYCDNIGPNYFNYSMENAGVIINELLLKIETRKDKKTPIILDYHFRSFEEDTVGSSINIRTYLPFIRQDEQIQEFLKENGRYRSHQVIPGARYFGVYSSYAKDNLANLSTRKVHSRGGVFNKQAPGPKSMERLIEARRSKGPAYFMRNSEWEERIEKIIRENPDRLFMLLGSPRHYSVIEMLQNYDEMKDWARALQQRHDNVRVIMFEADYPDRYFKDTGHLSLEGAQKFSSQLKEKLQEIDLYFEGNESDPVWPAKPDDIYVFELSE